MPQHDSLRIIPDLRDREHDIEQRREEHWNIFGHLPPEDPDESCQHPIHDAIRREMNGMTVEIPFDGSAIVSDDSELARQRDARYDAIYQATKEFQREIEAEDKLKRAREAGLILPGMIY